MRVIEFIKKHGTKALTDEYAISVKAVDDLLVLNYNQIDSPKTHPLVIECRSLILEAKTLKVVSRGFDRFFNYGEAQNVMPEIDFSKAVAHEKVDGSLIKIYNHKGHWYVSTRGTAYAESDCMGYGVSFKELVYKALGVNDDNDFQLRCRMSDLWHSFTYIFELTSVENRVVKRYEGYKLHYLAARDNQTGRYVSDTEKDRAMELGAEQIKEYRFDSVEECMRAVCSLKELDEGYVFYQDGEPICKVKSPAYVAVHHLRSEGLNPKRIMQLVLTGEEDEYLTYFPDDRAVMQPYIDANIKLVCHIDAVYTSIYEIEDQKEFAKKAGSFPFKAALFQARAKKIDPLRAFQDQRESYKIEILKRYL